MKSQTIPSRHGANKQAAYTVLQPMTLFLRNIEVVEPSDVDWFTLGRKLNDGDPLADDLVAWMLAEDATNRRKLFYQVVDGVVPIDSQLPGPLLAFMQAVTTAPKWLDHKQLTLATDVIARTGKIGMRVLRDFGLMAGYQAGAINHTLVITGTLEKGAPRRIAETTKWWIDCTGSDALNIDGAGFRSTLKVRVIHAMVRRHVADKSEWDASYYGLPINQVDMQATYLGFSTVFLIGCRLLGCIFTKEEAESVMHLWRYIGLLMGVDEALLSHSEESGRVALYRNILSQPTADESSRVLGRALMDEPLERHYRVFPWLRRRIEKQIHLSMTRLAVGPRGMKALGLPSYILPWYPLLYAPLNMTYCLLALAIPALKNVKGKIGRYRQLQQLKVGFGAQPAELKRMEV